MRATRRAGAAGVACVLAGLLAAAAGTGRGDVGRLVETPLGPGLGAARGGGGPEPRRIAGYFKVCPAT